MEFVKGDRTVHTEPEWENYYHFLENLRQSCVCNMWGATVYLEDTYNLTHEDASVILCNWIENYQELNKKYGWRN